MDRHSAFTLIELLLVIAIVSLLLSILLPALAGARESAKRTVCASNLRQIATGFWHYAEDHEGWFPAKAKWGVPDARITELATVQPQGTRDPTGAGWGLQFAGMIRDIVERRHTHEEAPSPRYLPDPKVLVCPSDTTGNKYSVPSGATVVPQMPVVAANRFEDIDATNSAKEKNYSYMYVALWRSDDRADYFMMGDESDTQDNATNSLTGLTPDDNHGRRGINALFCDTRVEWIGARGGNYDALQELAWRLWGPAVSARPRYPGTVGNRSNEVQTID